MGFTDRLANSWYIFKTSLGFIIKDKSLLVIPFLTILIIAVFCILFFSAFAVPKFGIAVTMNYVLFILGMYMITTFFAAAQSWMVHEVAEGRNTTVWSGVKRALANIGDIIAFAVVNLLIKMFVGGLRRKAGIAGQLAGGIISLITGILGKLVLPAMIVTDRNFVQAIKQMKHSIKVVPEIATFEIGIRPLTGLMIWIGLGISALLWLGVSILTAIVFFVLWILLISVFSVLINQIYYTLLYITLIEKRRIPGLKLSRNEFSKSI